MTVKPLRIAEVRYTEQETCLSQNLIDGEKTYCLVCCRGFSCPFAKCQMLRLYHATRFGVIMFLLLCLYIVVAVEE